MRRPHTNLAALLVTTGMMAGPALAVEPISDQDGWLAYDKAFYGDTIELPDDATMIHQERAYTSPIWYTP